MIDITDAQLKQALAKAEAMRDAGEDADFVGHALLALHARNELLVPIAIALQHYQHSGGAVTDRTRLVKALERWEESEGRRKERAGFGLSS